MIVEQAFPLFEDGRILKKEALDRIRDYAADAMAVLYRKYGDGIIEGFEIEGRPEGITVGEGILKDKGCYFVMKEPVNLEATVENETVLVLLRRLEEKYSNDFRIRRYDLGLSVQRELREGEYELGRFLLEKGARLRGAAEYKDIRDVQTQYNTLNLIHVKAACEGGSCLAPEILRLYAKDVLASETARPIDTAFAMACLSSGRISREGICRYLEIGRPGTHCIETDDNEQCYRLLVQLYAGMTRKNTINQPIGHRNGKTMID